MTRRKSPAVAPASRDPLPPGLAPSLDADGFLADWPPRENGLSNYEAPRPGWMSLANAWAGTPGGRRTYLAHGMTPDAAFIHEAEHVREYAATVRAWLKSWEEDKDELARLRRILAAEVDREEWLAEERQRRERFKAEAVARGQA